MPLGAHFGVDGAAQRAVADDHERHRDAGARRWPGSRYCTPLLVASLPAYRTYGPSIGRGDARCALSSAIMSTGFGIVYIGVTASLRRAGAEVARDRRADRNDGVGLRERAPLGPEVARACTESAATPPPTAAPARGRTHCVIIAIEQAGQSVRLARVVDQVGPVADWPVIAHRGDHRRVAGLAGANRWHRRQHVLRVDDVDFVLAQPFASGRPRGRSTAARS